MYLIPIGWLYVVVMMSVAEASSSNGSLLGALVTFVLYGVLPIGLLLYFIGTPARKRAIRAAEAAQLAQLEPAAQSEPHVQTPPTNEAAAQPGAHAPGDSIQPDAGGLAATDPVAPVGKEP